MRIVTFLFFCATSLLAQENKNTIVVKKNVKVSEVRLDSTFSKLLVYDQLHAKLDSCIVSFEMVVNTPVPNIYYGAPVGPIYKVSTAVTYKSNCAHLTPEMKKAWAESTKDSGIKFQHIYLKIGDQPQTKFRDFSVNKP